MKTLVYLKSPVMIDSNIFKKYNEDYNEILGYLLDNNLIEIDDIIYSHEDDDKVKGGEEKDGA